MRLWLVHLNIVLELNLVALRVTVGHEELTELNELGVRCIILLLSMPLLDEEAVKRALLGPLLRRFNSSRFH